MTNYGKSASDKVAEHASKNIRRLLISSGELRQGNYESAIERAIQAEEEELLQGFWAGEELFAVAGSTAALVVVNLTRGILVVANLGDSHVLLGEADGEDHTSLKVVCRSRKPVFIIPAPSNCYEGANNHIPQGRNMLGRGIALSPPGEPSTPMAVCHELVSLSSSHLARGYEPNLCRGVEYVAGAGRFAV